MNRHQRRRAKAMGRQEEFYKNYIGHLPRLPKGEPIQPGRMYWLAVRHDPWCKIYDTDNPSMANCNCNPELEYRCEPVRS
jgi:hypothetical protein